MDKKRKPRRRAALAAAALIAFAAVFAAAYFALRPQPAEGAKHIQVEIIFADNSNKIADIKTDAEYLRQALEENDLISGSEGEFGLFVIAVDGVTADAGRQEWWSFTKSGEQLMTGVDHTPVADGDHYEITLKTGYDF